MAVSVIQYCKDCKEHPYQDAKYGFKMRIMNPTGKMEKSGKARCTVCGAVNDTKGVASIIPRRK